ncbi:phosphate/phosphite/phosphonate ABC transporter substrate-binding protein [Corynebacterium lowii]|uniref:Phosphate-import protein PhnD n=1 Tax=Corynebacterium lowii TaxID=1544413 RepID=A0A0Q0U4G5_9CORY|nr:phosphate/phosphite/phosphonate ABC transporter substrate-binding protein [Corynebacterium lowii]KQB86878.1 Phosphate-import protein PhnD precursor [Corynebacterium lowii]MDP9851566.1 phosphonate transport system substrate-binding protein [Corynebacterium lowii]
MKTMTTRKAVKTTGSTAIAAALLASGLVACAPGGQGPDDPTCPNGKIAFGIEPYEAPDKLEPAYRSIAEDLGRALDCEVEVMIVEDYSAEVLAMRNGSLHLGQFGPLGFVFADRIAQAEPLVSFAQANGELSSYTAGIWVRAESPVYRIEDLRGRDLALGSVGSTSGDALPRMALSEAGLSENEVTTDYAGGHPEALLALKNGTVEAAEINSQTLAAATAQGTFDPQAYRQIWVSEPIPNDPITITAHASEELKDNVRRALSDVEPATIAQVAELLDVDPPGRLIPVTKDDYRSLYHLADELGMSIKDVP